MTPTGQASSATWAMAIAQWVEEQAERGVFTTDMTFAVQSWNRWLEVQTGIPASKALGRSLFAVVPSLTERGFDQYYRDALSGESRVLSERLHRYLIPVDRNAALAGVKDMAQTARIAPLISDGVVIGTISVIDDVTERLVAERELRTQIATSDRARALAEDSSRIKDEFLATLSHEIRTPLNAVLGWTHILRTQSKVKSTAHALEVIERNAVSQMRLVEDLLDVARVISGKLKLDVKTVPLTRVAQAAIDVVAPAAAAKSIKISTHFPARSPLVSGDRDRLQQTIWNVMANAVKFTDQNGRIEVKISASGSSVLLSVQDNGQGIAPDFLPHVFDRFRQADSSASRRHGGLGLGLALVQQIVELHGGTIVAESAGSQRGACFTMRFPAAPKSATVPRAGLRPKQGIVSLRGVSVLVVDDDADGREMLRTALSDFGASVIAVASAEEAIRRISTVGNTPDILVSDLGMPDTDGYEMIRRIRSSGRKATRDTPAIAVTGYANPEDRLRALRAGFQEHIAKPINHSHLASTIEQLATRRKRGSTNRVRRA